MALDGKRAYLITLWRSCLCRGRLHSVETEGVSGFSAWLRLNFLTAALLAQTLWLWWQSTFFLFFVQITCFIWSVAAVKTWPWLLGDRMQDVCGSAELLVQSNRQREVPVFIVCPLRRNRQHSTTKLKNNNKTTGKSVSECYCSLCLWGNNHRKWGQLYRR